MEIRQKEILKKYWEEMKDNYVGMNFEEFSKICMHPWGMLREVVCRDDMPKVRMLGLGLFIVYVGKCTATLTKIQNKLNADPSLEGYYRKAKNRMLDYLDNEENHRKTKRRKRLPTGEFEE